MILLKDMILHLMILKMIWMKLKQTHTCFQLRALVIDAPKRRKREDENILFLPLLLTDDVYVRVVLFWCSLCPLDGPSFSFVFSFAWCLRLLHCNRF